MTVWVDADACPREIKAFVFRRARRSAVDVVLVANRSMEVPRSERVSLVVVGKGLDEADHYIVHHCTPGDLVVTADIPLAAELVSRGVAVVDPRGMVYTANNVQEALATRNLMQDLRNGGVVTSGPRAFGQKDREAFANALDRELTRLRNQGAAGT